MRTKVVAVDTTCHWVSYLKFMATMVIVVVVSVINIIIITTIIIIIPIGPNIFFFSKLQSRLWAHPASYAMHIVFLCWGKAAGAWC